MKFATLLTPSSIRAVWSESSLGACRIANDSRVCSCWQQRLLSDCVDAQDDLSLPWAPMSAGTCTFSRVTTHILQGLVVQSVVNLTSSFAIKILTVLVVRTISNLQDWHTCWRNVSSFANAKATHIFFSKNISVYAIFNDQSFNDT